MKTVRVRLGKRSYPVYIGKGSLDKISAVSPSGAGSSVFIVTNKKINRLYGAKLKKYLAPVSEKISICEVPDSEKAKSFPVYLKAAGELARFARKSRPLIVAFGGGVIGDLTGFLASTYRRGVPYINVPTTLLAQVDSAIGGKVAIDIKEAKNIIGNFYQPKMVVCDPGFLKTLPEKEVRNGLVEIVKYGIIKDKGFFLFLDKALPAILRLEEKSLEHIIYVSCSIKARIVETDERDSKDVRAILNFGHTIGHALEASFGYSKSITHGHAVALGMIMANHIAMKLGMIRKGDFAKINSLLKIVMPGIQIRRLNVNNVLKALSYDKKFVGGVNRFILPKRIGLVKIVDNVPESLIKEAVKSGISEE